MRLIGVLLVFAGCANPIASVMPDGAPMHDGQPPAGGLTVSWNADPGLPGTVTDKITVTEVTFQLEYLQVESDVGPAEKTTQSRFQLHWASGVTPEQDVFPEAPVATYQNILIAMRSAPLQAAYEIKGSWEDDEGSGVGSGSRPFRITDNVPMIMLQIPCQKTLPAGGLLSIPIKVDLKKALDNVDLKNVPPIGGVLVVEGGPQLMAVRNQMSKVFGLENGD